MAAWDATQYLRFERERTQACLDLAHRVELTHPREVVDLGCGPGNSTAVLRARWPTATVTGVDNSTEMLERARASDSTVRWVQANLRDWRSEALVDLVFSNAALQWLPDHPELVPRVWAGVAPGGALAFQVPAPGSQRSRWVDAIQAVLQRPAWTDVPSDDPAGASVLSLDEYYRLLSEGAYRIDLWDTEYDHVLPDPAAIVEWVKGTGLRPVLDRLGTEPRRQAFLKDFAQEVERAYPRQSDGRVLFPFLRRFVVAYRAER